MKLERQIAKRAKPKKKKKYIEYKGYCLKKIFYPIGILFIEYNLAKEKFWNKIGTPKNVAKVVDKLFPIVCEIDLEENELFYLYDWCTSNWYYRCPWYHPILKKFAKIHSRKMRDYVKDELQIDGYSKRIEQDYDDIYVVFKKI